MKIHLAKNPEDAKFTAISKDQHDQLCGHQESFGPTVYQAGCITKVVETASNPVLPKIEELSPYPIGANPFNIDHYHMGTDLVRGWIIMHPGFDNKKSPQPLPYLEMVNTRTGQRFKVTFDTALEEEILKNHQGEIKGL